MKNTLHFFIWRSSVWTWMLPIPFAPPPSPSGVGRAAGRCRAPRCSPGRCVPLCAPGPLPNWRRWLSSPEQLPQRSILLWEIYCGKQRRWDVIIAFIPGRRPWRTKASCPWIHGVIQAFAEREEWELCACCCSKSEWALIKREARPCEAAATLPMALPVALQPSRAPRWPVPALGLLRARHWGDASDVKLGDVTPGLRRRCRRSSCLCEPVLQAALRRRREVAQLRVLWGPPAAGPGCGTGIALRFAPSAGGGRISRRSRLLTRLLRLLGCPERIERLECASSVSVGAGPRGKDSGWGTGRSLSCGARGLHGMGRCCCCHGVLWVNFPR